jgi:hypothetical protein
MGEASVGTAVRSVRRSGRWRRARGVALSGDGGTGEAGAVRQARGVLSRCMARCPDSTLRRAREIEKNSPER